MFLSHDIECDIDLRSDQKTIKGIAKWSHIRDFYELDKNNPNFVYAPALTEKHLNPNAKQKMRVKLAAQVFSHSVTAGILAKVTTNELPTDALATGTILKKFDDLFDALNADSPDARRGKRCSTNMTHRSPHLKLFEDMKVFIRGMKFMGSSRTPPSQSGWIRTINAVERLWRNLNNLGIHSLSTRRLNQDALENFFGCVRYNSGSNCNPTVSQFIAGVKTAIISNLRHACKRKNCEDDNAALVDNLKAFLMTPGSDKGPELILETEPHTADSEIDLFSPEAQACAYVCGFIVKKMRSESCDQCKKALLANGDNELAHIFTSFKEYDATKKSLKYVSCNLVQAVECSACVLNNLFKNVLYKNNIKLLAVSTLERINFQFLDVCRTHYSENVNFIKTSVFYIVIKRHLVLKNRGFAEEEQKKQMDRKLKILKHQ
ncbi:hypothetical protein O0L34_g12599 [Tuta absoluta]|nr:hypothetical protein O0L34_g12599 [Tuta absoluta]